MAKITAENTRRLADVIRLNLSEEEVTKYTEQLNDVITYANKLNELSIDDIQRTTHLFDAKNVLREDEAVNKLSHEEALQNAPEHEDGLMKVPAILEE